MFTETYYVSGPVPGTKMECFLWVTVLVINAEMIEKGSSLPSLLSEILTPIQLGSISLFLASASTIHSETDTSIELQTFC